MSARATDSGIRLEPPSDTPGDVPLRPVAPRRVGPLAFAALVLHLTVRELRSTQRT